MCDSFPPYSEVYGRHPADFVFDAEGNMVDRGHGSIIVGGEVECLRFMGVSYRTRPQLHCLFGSMREVAFGDRVIVRQVVDGWVKDSFGWLPLELDGEILFKAVEDAEEGGQLSRLYFGEHAVDSRLDQHDDRRGSWDLADLLAGSVAFVSEWGDEVLTRT